MTENNQIKQLSLFPVIADEVCNAQSSASSVTPEAQPELCYAERLARKLENEKKYGKQLSQWTGTKDDLHLDDIPSDPVAHVLTIEEIAINLEKADIRDRGAYGNIYGPSAYFKKIANPDCL